jgi:hypothetical protein
MNRDDEEDKPGVIAFPPLIGLADFALGRLALALASHHKRLILGNVEAREARRPSEEEARPSGALGRQSTLSPIQPRRSIRRRRARLAQVAKYHERAAPPVRRG